MSSVIRAKGDALTLDAVTMAVDGEDVRELPVRPQVLARNRERVMVGDRMRLDDVSVVEVKLDVIRDAAVHPTHDEHVATRGLQEVYADLASCVERERAT